MEFKSREQAKRGNTLWFSLVPRQDMHMWEKTIIHMWEKKTSCRGASQRKELTVEEENVRKEKKRSKENEKKEEEEEQKKRKRVKERKDKEQEEETGKS